MKSPLGVTPILALGLLTSATAHAQISSGQQQPSLFRLASYLSGSFSSEEQARRDSAYADIRLQMVQIWTGGNDVVWLYVEQASARSLSRPYRQRVYSLSATGDSTFLSTVYLLPAWGNYAGMWRTPDEFLRITPDSLTPRAGCSIHLRLLPDGTFRGGTEGAECLSEIHGAAFATSEVTIGERWMVSWDRGFAADGKQVWGATQGGYTFVKTSSYHVRWP